MKPLDPYGFLYPQTQKEETPSRRLKITVHKTEGFTKEGVDFYLGTMAIIEKRINTQNWKDMILASTYYKKGWFGGTKTYPGFYGYSDTPLQVYNRFMSGFDVREDGADGEVDLLVRLVKMAPEVIGSMNPGSPWYNLNSFHFDAWLDENLRGELADNWGHEYTHHIGYPHTTKIKYLRSQDPAYAIGHDLRRLFFLPEESLIPL